MKRINAVQMERVMKYVNRIRNKGKKAYALAYVDYLNGGAVPHDGAFGISVMARQAVRLNIEQEIKPAT